MILAIGTLQKVKGNESPNGLQVDFQVEPSRLEPLLLFGTDLEAIHGYVHSRLL
jgi:hypothetical protein